MDDDVVSRMERMIVADKAKPRSGLLIALYFLTDIFSFHVLHTLYL